MQEMKEKNVPPKRKNEEEEEEDFGDDEDNIPKKNNNTKEGKEGKEGKEKKKAKTGDEIYDIGARKKLTVGSYKGNLLINIREYYEDKKTGEEKPGSKGIALTVEQWRNLKKHIQDVDDAIEAHEE